MKYVDEFRDAELVKRLCEHIHQQTTQAWSIMEVCGGQTQAIVRFGLDELLPDCIQLIHGPGCPVCVTPNSLIDAAIDIAQLDNVIFCSFGDMLRVPGTSGDLMNVQACGGDVRIVYSPLDAVAIAQKEANKQVVFFAVGFETTAPANALAIQQADQLGLNNFSILVSHVLVPPAIEAILTGQDNCVQGFLAAGHVCTIMGCEEYYPLAEHYQVPIVITGFEPVDILHGIALCVQQLEAGEHRVENQYQRSVREDGNLPAKDLINKIFSISTCRWRGMGEIANSGLALRAAYRRFDAADRFQIQISNEAENGECISGDILRGAQKPFACPAFGNRCTPEHPLGATMVSHEGACAAYYHYRYKQKEQ